MPAVYFRDSELTLQTVAPLEASQTATPTNVVPLADQFRSARSLQQEFLPGTLPSLSDWGIAGSCISAGAIGGDFYDVFQMPCGGTMLLVADVMGKGMPAALIASVARTVFRMAVLTATGPADAFARVNQMLYEDLSNADMFLTAQAAWLEPGARTLRVASAGHCPLLLKDLSGKVQGVSPCGMPIGVSTKATFSEASISLETIESVLIYTDGVPDARSARGDFFGQERLEQWLTSFTTRFSGAHGLKQALLGEVERFQAGTDQFDDQTVLVLTRKQAVSIC